MLVEISKPIRSLKLTRIHDNKQGGNSEAYTAEHSSCPKLFAKYTNEYQIVAEYCVLHKLGTHPHIQTLHGITRTEAGLVLLTEYLPGGSLRDRLNKYNLDGALKALISVIHTVGFVHSKGIIHRDLKPEAIMFDHEGVPKLTDFGQAIKRGNCRNLSTVGSPPYAAPEQYSGKCLPTSDVHALGVIAWEIISGLSDDELLDSVAAIWNDYPDSSIPTVIAASMNKNPNKRPSIAELAQACATTKVPVAA